MHECLIPLFGRNRSPHRCPVTVCRFDRPSCTNNATGYFLRALIFWFGISTVRLRTAPIRVPRRYAAIWQICQLAFAATCKFDPLRDVGIEYAKSLAAAGPTGRAVSGERTLPLVAYNGRRGDHRHRGATGKAVSFVSQRLSPRAHLQPPAPQVAVRRR